MAKVPLRWHKCVECGWEDLMPVGSKPWICDLCVSRQMAKKAAEMAQSIRSELNNPKWKDYEAEQIKGRDDV